MEEKHTPGPWELRPDEMGGLSSLIYPAGEDHPVAAVTASYSGDGMRLANARLIAAAPDLLAALDMARTLLVDIEEYSVDGASIRVIDAALAKATQ